MFEREELIPIALTDLREKVLTIDNTNKDLVKAVNRYAVLAERLHKNGELNKRDYNSRQDNFQTLGDLLGVRALFGIGLLNKSQYRNHADDLKEEKEIDDFLINLISEAARHELIKVTDSFRETFGVLELTPEEKYEVALTRLEEFESMEVMDKEQYKEYQKTRIYIGNFERNYTMVDDAKWKLKHSSPAKDAEDARAAAQARVKLFGTNVEEPQSEE